MFDLKAASRSDAAAVLKALDRSLATIEFDSSGKILTANENFCSAMDYSLSEIKGQHHSMFIDPAYARSPEYTVFWTKLRRGEFDAGEYKRIRKGGGDIWFQASYSPVLNSKGEVLKVVKVAIDITTEKLRNAEFEGKINAISRVQGVIEFMPSGEAITANENFLSLLGYRLEEIRGQHHRLFVEPAYARSPEYEEFWKKLNNGEFVAAEFKRLGKGGKEVWIQASYNPIFDLNNKITKIVKFAIDVTGRVHAVNQIGAGLERLANRDLEVRIETKFIPAFEKLRSDFNLSIEKVCNTLQQILESTNAIHSGTQEISTAADDLSRRTENQAASLEETAAALNQITTTAKKAAEGASHARDVVAAADEDAKKSTLIVRQAVEAIDTIAKSAQQISQIIGVIDEIAFQTNLLALNAGVEAARAGDAGRGFAVVASEVRALAQRSAEAAKEIKSLIMTSSAQVEQGVKLVNETGRSLERIMEQVSEINGIVLQIAGGAKEQSIGLGEVNTAITQMDQVTQQNAAMVEETTAASHSLTQETEQLSQLIGQFQIGQTNGNDQIRHELKKVAPHAFRAAPKTSAASKVRAGAREPAPRLQSAKAKVVNGGPSDADAGWREF